MEHLFRTTPQGGRESRVDISPKATPISKGAFTHAQETTVSVHGAGNRTREIPLVVRNPIHETALTQSEQMIWLDIHQRLRALDIPTYTTMRSDGDTLYTTALNTDTQTAVSVNNEIPDRALHYQENITIANSEQLIQSIFESTHKAIEGGIDIQDYDAFFYLIHEPDSANDDTHIVEVMLGDYGCLEVNPQGVATHPFTSFDKARVSLELFFERFGTASQEEAFDKTLEEIYRTYVPE